MPLPTNNLKMHIDFSNTASVFEAFANPPTDAAEDGDNIEVVVDAGDSDQVLTVGVPASEGFTYRLTAGHASLATAEANGSTERMSWFNDAGSITKKLNNFAETMSPHDFTAYLAVKIVTGSGANDAASYDLPQVIGDTSGYWGVGSRQNGSTYSLDFWSYDTATRSINHVISLNQWYVFRFRKTGGNLRLSVDGGSETTATCGALGSATGAMRLADGYGGILSSNAFYGELAMYNVGAQGGTDMTDATDYFTDKWLAAAAARANFQLLLGVA